MAYKIPTVLSQSHCVNGSKCMYILMVTMQKKGINQYKCVPTAIHMLMIIKSNKVDNMFEKRVY